VERGEFFADELSHQELPKSRGRGLEVGYVAVAEMHTVPHKNASPVPK